MKFTKWAVLFVLAATLLIASVNARAQLASFQDFSAVLTGAQQVPGVPTAASGSVRLYLRNYEPGPFTPAFDLQASFTGLSGGWTMAGLYGPADPGQTGPLIANFTNIPLYPPPGATAGEFQIMDYWQVSRAQIDALLAGKVYFNLHSTVFPGGEIRGQLLKEPAAPSGGTMTMSPPTPVVPDATLTVNFTGWLDGSLPLTYAVLVDDVVVSPQGPSASRTFTGPSAFGTHTVKGRIHDAGNNVTEVTQTFTVGRVSTGTASPVTATGATLNGSVNAGGSSMEVFFDVSIDGVNFKSFPAVPATVSGNVNMGVTAAMADLSPKTDYRFRVRGMNSMETFFGATQTFTTPGNDALAFSSTDYIEFPGLNPPNPGEASPYPSIIPATGVTGTVSTLRVKLNGLFHGYPDDLDVFLMAPGGAVAALMSDAGENWPFYGDLVFDNAALSAIPDGSRITSGTYSPANYEPDETAPPGGVGSIGTSLKALAAGGGNGAWKLFVTDDVQRDFGWIESWSVLIDTNLYHEAWRQFYFGTPDNTGNAADNFDYDKDGLTNLLEWACSLNPTSPGSIPMSVGLNGMNLELTYSRSVSALNYGAVFEVEWSDDLAAGSWSSSGVTETILSDSGVLQEVKATIPAGSGNRRFLHLKVTGP